MTFECSKIQRERNRKYAKTHIFIRRPLLFPSLLVRGQLQYDRLALPVLPARDYEDRAGILGRDIYFFCTAAVRSGFTQRITPSQLSTDLKIDPELRAGPVRALILFFYLAIQISVLQVRTVTVN